MCRRLKDRSLRTPDFSTLTLYKELPLFVYGEECPSGYLNYLLTDAKTYGDAHTVSSTYIMKQSRALRNPVVFDAPRDGKLNAKIRGKLYGVSVEHLHTLDIAKANWKEHFRTERWVYCESIIPGTKIVNGFSTVKAFIYIGIPEYWETEKLIEKTRIEYGWNHKLKDIEFYHHPNYVDKTDLLDDASRWRNWGIG